MAAARTSHDPTDAEWKAIRSEFTTLYMEGNYTLSMLMNHFSKRGFKAS